MVWPLESFQRPLYFHFHGSWFVWKATLKYSPWSQSNMNFNSGLFVFVCYVSCFLKHLPKKLHRLSLFNRKKPLPSSWMKRGITPHIASRNTMFIVRPTGSHSYRYLYTNVVFSFLFFSSLIMNGFRQKHIFPSINMHIHPKYTINLISSAHSFDNFIHGKTNDLLPNIPLE